MGAAWRGLIAAALVLAGPGRAIAGPERVYTEARPASATEPSEALPDLTRLAQAAVPAVVGVLTTQEPPAPGDDSLRDLFDKLHDGPRKGIGSGFFINKDGWVLTNAHVVEGASKIEVDLGDGAPKLPAKIVGSDAESDVALLKVDSDRPFPFIPLGDSDRISVAEWVLVVGSPFGLEHSVTKGIVSHAGRSDISPVGRPGTYDFIQIDASINPGNSGGPVLNLRGEAIGIATAVNATGQGIGFAIPIDMAKVIVQQLHDRGRVVRSWLGVAVRESPPGPNAKAGLVVTEVTAGGPADAAGVKVGDVITGFEGRAVRSPARLHWYVSTAGVGREVELRVRRGPGAERAIHVALVGVPAAEQARAQARASLGED